jgi:hypothetical protein
MRSLTRTSLLMFVSAARMPGLVSCSPFFPAPSPTIPIIPIPTAKPVPHDGEFIFWSREAIPGMDRLKAWNIADIPLP